MGNIVHRLSYALYIKEERNGQSIESVDIYAGNFTHVDFFKRIKPGNNYYSVTSDLFSFFSSFLF